MHAFTRARSSTTSSHLNCCQGRRQGGRSWSAVTP
uniref:Uncharacterized protein n=1 Tax=Arundo donax TaxID=35708 RepID=A0A0A8Y7Y7_ARUDO